MRAPFRRIVIFALLFLLNFSSCEAGLQEKIAKPALLLKKFQQELLKKAVASIPFQSSRRSYTDSENSILGDGVGVGGVHPMNQIITRPPQEESWNTHTTTTTTMDNNNNPTFGSSGGSHSLAQIYSDYGIQNQQQPSPNVGEDNDPLTWNIVAVGEGGLPGQNDGYTQLPNNPEFPSSGNTFEESWSMPHHVQGQEGSGSVTYHEGPPRRKTRPFKKIRNYNKIPWWRPLPFKPFRIYTTLGKAVDIAAHHALPLVKKGAGKIASSQVRLGGTLTYVSTELLARFIEARAERPDTLVDDSISHLSHSSLSSHQPNIIIINNQNSHAYNKCARLFRKFFPITGDIKVGLYCWWK